MTTAEEFSGNAGEIVLFRAKDGRVSLDVQLEDDSIWLNLNQVSALFERDKSVVSRHFRYMFRSGELNRDSVVAFFAIAQHEGGRELDRSIEYFNLDAILSVGYRVNTSSAT